MGKALKQNKQNRIRAIASFLLILLLVVSSSSFVFGSKINSKTNEKFDELNFKVFFEEPVLNNINVDDRTFTQIYMNNCISNAKPGNPSLPLYPIKILLPQGKKLSKLNVFLSDKIKLNYNLEKNPVIPQQKPILIGIDNEIKKFEMNRKIYDSTEPIVDQIYSHKNVNYCRGYTILSLMLNPIQYIPKNGELFYYPEMTISIKLEDDNCLNSLYRKNSIDEEWVENLVFNPEDVGNYGTGNLPIFSYENGLCDPSEDYDYVIITTTSGGLDDWATSGSLPYNWTSLMNKHSTDYGFNCTLVTIEDIVDCSDYWNDTALFNDTPAMIREFCKDAYLDWNTSYILIGGDDEILPAREMDYAYESDVDSDIYWNHLDNSFNADEDSEWGEEDDEGFDLYSEMYIGRLTCDEPQDVSNWMNKSFTYTNSNLSDYIENAGFYGGNTGWTVEGDDFIDYSAIKGTDNWLGPNPGADGPFPSWAGFQFGFETWNSENPNNQFNLSVKWTGETPNTGWSGGSKSAAINGLKNAINSNDVTLLSGIAHANSGMSLDVTANSWESNYHNTLPFFLHDYGCHCGDMDASDDGVLHSMLFHSDTELAFACVYNTGFGFGNLLATNSSSAFQQKLFWDYFFDIENNSISTDNWQLGKAMAFSKDSMAPTINWNPTHGTWRGVIQSCLLFGDPAQKLKPPTQNLNLSSENPTNESTNVCPGNINLGITVYDAEQDTMNITFRTNATGDWQDIGINESQQNGEYIQKYEFNNYNTTYWWSINVSDLTGNSGWLNETYYFLTRSQYIPVTPSDFSANKYNRSAIDLSWINTDFNNTYIEWNTTNSWAYGEGNLLYNGTNSNFRHNNLSFETKYYYQAWSWNETDNCWSTSNVSSNATTDSNSAPNISGVVPTNSSSDIDINYSVVNVTISDIDLDNFNWTIQGQYVTNNASNDDINGNKSANLITPLPYITEIIWYVNVTDGYNWTNETYHFFTVENQAPSFSSISPTNGSTGVSISTSTLSLTITDSDSDLFNWTITTNPNIGSNSGNYNSSSSKTCGISSLDYSTKYYWYVSAIDTVNNTWSNATYWFQTENQPSNPPTSGGLPPPPSENNIPSSPSLIDGPSEGYINNSYSFSISSTDSDNDQIKYKIDWGDETISDWTDYIDPDSLVSFTHNWQVSGSYIVKAKAKDENGGESSWTEIVTITISESTNSNQNSNNNEIIIDIPENNTANQPISFDIVELNQILNENLTFFWDFGDGTNSTKQKPNHSYTNPGTYTITLDIYDSNGSLINTTTYEITISEGSSGESKITEEKTAENKQISLFWPLSIIIFVTILCLIFFIFYKKIVSISPKQNHIEANQRHALKIKAYNQKFQEYVIKPKDIPPDMLKAYYDHDIGKIIPDKNLQQSFEVIYNEKENIKQIKKHPKKPDFKGQPSKNKEK